MDERPPHLRERYRRIALVAHERHLAALDGQDADTLIVSSDWLLWQDLAERGAHCVFYEQGIACDELDDSVANDVVVRANDWVYVDGEDVTRFQGVSLGKQFSSHVNLAIASFVKLEAAIRGLIGTYRPQEILFFEFRLERLNPDLDQRYALVCRIAAENGVAVSDCRDPLDPADPAHPSDPVSRPRAAPRKGLKPFLLIAYQAAINLVCRGALLALGRRPRVLVWLGQNLSMPLIERFAGRDVQPIFPALQMPKTARFIVGCLKRGIVLAALTAPRLSRAEKGAVDRMTERLRAAHDGPADAFERFVRDHVRKYVLEPRQLARMARQVKGCRKLLSAWRPTRIVIDGVKNPPLRPLAELAHARGLGVDYIWHAPMAPQNIRFDALGCDPRMDPIVSRCLSWGPINDEWLRRIGAKVPATRVGNPILERYRRLRRPAAPVAENVLVLQYSAIHTDIKTLNAVQFQSFVQVVRMLMAEGYSTIRYKLHPGYWRVSYFERIAERFGLDCTVHRDEPFEDFVDWADFVIGPVFSGAMLEVLAARKDYYAMLVPPTSLDGAYLDGVDLHQDIESLRESVRNRPAVDHDGILHDFCSARDIPDPAARLWEVLSRGTDALGRAEAGDDMVDATVSADRRGAA